MVINADDELPAWVDLGDGADDRDYVVGASTAPPRGPESALSESDGPAEITSPESAYAEGDPFAAALKRRTKRWRLPFGIGLLVALLATGVTSWLAFDAPSSTSKHASVAPIAAANQTDVADHPGSSCPTTTGSVNTGSDPGGLTGGAQVIKAFDYAYYVRRNAVAARDVVATDANVGTSQAIQAGIDAVAPGTTHCLMVTERGGGEWGVVLTQTPPNGGAPLIIKQKIQTVDNGGRTWITSITPDSP